MCGRFVMVPRGEVERIVRAVEAGLPIGPVDLGPGPDLPAIKPQVAPYQPALFDLLDQDAPHGPAADRSTGRPVAAAVAAVPGLAPGGQDVFPGARVPVVVPGEEEGRLAVADLNWGYPVSWSKRPVFNTRVDTATGPRGALWRDSLAQRRCAVPTLGFYEPHRTERAASPRTGREVKVQYAFALPEHPVTFIAGIYEDDHFSLMTCEPNRWIRDVHDRMPLVLRPAEIAGWLGPDYPALFDRDGVELARCAL